VFTETESDQRCFSYLIRYDLALGADLADGTLPLTLAMIHPPADIALLR